MAMEKLDKFLQLVNHAVELVNEMTKRQLTIITKMNIDPDLFQEKINADEYNLAWKGGRFGQNYGYFTIKEVEEIIQACEASITRFDNLIAEYSSMYEIANSLMYSNVIPKSVQQKWNTTQDHDIKKEIYIKEILPLLTKWS